MSAQKRSRAYEAGRVKALRRMKQPIALHVEASAPPRNPVARALAARSLGGGGGRHIRSQGAQRRADRMALQHALRSGWDS
ncbi:hypothetical protein Acav_2652 [Paracidovorax avenae ATCC 19860]|uniref:Uncharacterized protein n=1 Tax=Paracidovorax avenae (strain ATCC 19860 / DSM 7227 / CCUG 15838 / JCM 20985 / LMG 2117 / NCPPB 1011) TaxID=643561 RepID=F0Q2B6_PARA1|nr:hypothetical protein [Paracidovorax avenae]ADX46564.1 hypothetical protein Acav_2652 [Paracidovorax avenae ATCC 19860]